VSFPQIVEVILGLVLIYYILGAVVSTITKILTESLETRGVALEKYLLRIAGDKTIDLTNLPQIRALRPIRYANWWNVFGAGTEEKRVEKIPASTLVDAFFDLSGLSGKPSYGADELTQVVSQLPESEGKQAMLRWVQQGVTDLKELRSRTTDYFTGLLGQAALTFKARARSIVIILSMLITLAFGTDTIQLARDLWTNAALREVAAAQAKTVAAQPQGDVSQLPDLVSSLATYSMRLGWWQAPTTPPPADALSWFTFVVLKLAGLGITAVAVSQGSSFWYDVLKRLTGQSGQPATEGGEAVG
jgi:hypothetical protein